MFKKDELTIIEKILLSLQKNNGILATKEILTEIGYIYYRPLRILRGLGLIEIRGGKVSLLKIENDDGKIDILSFLKILREFGLTNTDMEILNAKGESPEEIAQEKRLPVNMVRQHETNILVRLGVGNLKEARRKSELIKEKILA